MTVAVKVVDELVAHPVKEQLPGVDFCVNSNPSWGIFASQPFTFMHAMFYKQSFNFGVTIYCFTFTN